MLTVISTIAVLVLVILIFRSFSKGENKDQDLVENDAKRFAKLLVSEIKLYNEYKLQRGLKNNNLYESLNLEIEEARKKFKKRFSKTDFDWIFDNALVEVLADGDKSKLGIATNTFNK